MPSHFSPSSHLTASDKAAARAAKLEQAKEDFQMDREEIADEQKEAVQAALDLLTVQDIKTISTTEYTHSTGLVTFHLFGGGMLTIAKDGSVAYTNPPSTAIANAEETLAHMKAMQAEFGNSKTTVWVTAFGKYLDVNVLEMLVRAGLVIRHGGKAPSMYTTETYELV